MTFYPEALQELIEEFKEVSDKQIYENLCLKDGSVFLQYSIKSVTKSHLLFEVSRKSNIQLFVSSRF